MPEPDQKRPDEPRASNFSGRSAGGTAREDCYTLYYQTSLPRTMHKFRQKRTHRYF